MKTRQQKRKNNCVNIQKASKKITKNYTSNYKAIQYIPTYTLDLSREPFELFQELYEKHKDIGAVKLICDWNMPNCFRQISHSVSVSVQCLQDLSSGKNFKLIPGLYTVKQFKDMADSFDKKCPKGDIEQQYWELVNRKNKQRTTVKYGSDLPSLYYGSGFPQYEFQSKEYFQNKYNFHNINKQQDSLFQIIKGKDEQISGVTTSWMYLGMRYASFCWHTENMFFPSLNYHHEGANRTWYFIPEQDKHKFDKYFSEKFPELGSNYTNLLNKIIVQIDPLELKKRNINVFKTIQTPKSFILTFPKAYHCGFSHGFNMTEALNLCFPACLNYMRDSLKEETKQPLFPLELFSVGILESRDQFKFSEKALTEIIRFSKEIINQELQLRQIVQFKDPAQKSNAKYHKIKCPKCNLYPYLSYILCKQCLRITCLKCNQPCILHENCSTIMYRINDEELSKMLE